MVVIYPKSALVQEMAGRRKPFLESILIKNKLPIFFNENAYIFFEKIRLENVRLLFIPKVRSHLRVNRTV